MNRREFLKGMAVAGAASVAGGLGMGPSFHGAGTAHAAGRNKLVFISDLHMNVQGSYAWLVNHASKLAEFLNKLNSRSDVAELIILGDMLDDWVTPVEYTPQTFADVLEANRSNGIVPALQQICANPDIQVSYVTGNHDMLSCLAENKAVIDAYLPGMTIYSEAPGLGAYTRDNIIWAEHGHRYTLFNAPDVWSRPNGHLPMGYFITRCAASKSLEAGKLYTTPEVLDLFFHSPSQVRDYLDSAGYNEAVGGAIDDAMIIAIFNGIALWSDHFPWSPFTMNDLDSFSRNPYVEEIAFRYDDIFSKWPSRQNIVNHYNAVLNELGSLGSAADLLFEMPDRIQDLYPFTPRIILFGHTHHAAFRYHADDVDTIYANTGTWVDSNPNMTWVEIEINPESSGQRDYTVSLWFNGESEPRHSATVSVQTKRSFPVIRHR